MVREVKRVYPGTKYFGVSKERIWRTPEEMADRSDRGTGTWRRLTHVPKQRMMFSKGKSISYD